LKFPQLQSTRQRIFDAATRLNWNPFATIFELLERFAAVPHSGRCPAYGVPENDSRHPPGLLPRAADSGEHIGGRWRPHLAPARATDAASAGNQKNPIVMNSGLRSDR
jgi:hypothetical protein